MAVFKFTVVNARSQNSLSRVQGSFWPARRRVGKGILCPSVVPPTPAPGAPPGPAEPGGLPACCEPCLGVAVWQAPQRPQRPDADLSPQLSGDPKLQRRETQMPCDAAAPAPLCSRVFPQPGLLALRTPKRPSLLGPRARVSDFHEISFPKRLRQWAPRWSGASLPAASAPPGSAHLLGAAGS